MLSEGEADYINGTPKRYSNNTVQKSVLTLVNRLKHADINESDFDSVKAALIQVTNDNVILQGKLDSVKEEYREKFRKSQEAAKKFWYP